MTERESRGASRRLRNVFKKFGDARERARRGSAIGFDKSAGFASHFGAARRILNQVDPHFSELRGARHLDAHTCARKSRSHVAEILHRRAEDGRLGKPRGFKNIMSARRNERAADENRVGERIKTSEFADGIEDENVTIFVERRFHIERAPTNGFPAAFFDGAHGGVETLGLARRENEKGVPPLALDNIVSGENDFLFTGNDAACDEQRPALLLANLPDEPIAESSRRSRFVIVFHIAADFDASQRRAHFFQATRVFGRLREEKVGVVQNALEEFPDQRFETAEAAKRFFRDATVDENYRNIGAIGFAHEVRPDFRFENYNESRTELIEVAADGAGPVKRKIKNTVGGSDVFARDALARGGGRREEHLASGETLLEAVDERLGGENFADGDGMNPDGGGAGISAGERWGQMSHALAEAGEIFSAADSLQSEIRREQHHANRHQHAVKKIHVGSEAPVEKNCRTQEKHYSGNARSKPTTFPGAGASMRKK